MLIRLKALHYTAFPISDSLSPCAGACDKAVELHASTDRNPLSCSGLLFSIVVPPPTCLFESPAATGQRKHPISISPFPPGPAMVTLFADPLQGYCTGMMAIAGAKHECCQTNTTSNKVVGVMPHLSNTRLEASTARADQA